ncbi:hypothetical protein ACX27_24100 [Nostoc piscinale CENA21]|uniref:Uncharacterized protein n=1 Tax=Nostoc piscinale CENA21 TaxID=224013 RepID=A0A0M5MJ44_9NOSO|nr:hypothetical protein [Nostoc piscinale]ALF55212.1 hypothetical protein ACX27_24100 [Nostoc piscinale CENA21]
MIARINHVDRKFNQKFIFSIENKGILAVLLEIKKCSDRIVRYIWMILRFCVSKSVGQNKIILRKVNLAKTLFPPASCLFPTTNIYVALHYAFPDDVDSLNL